MAQTLNFNGIQAESITFNGVIVSNVYFNGSLVYDSVKYLRDLSSINEDCLILPNSTLNTDIPATGDFEFGMVMTVPNTPPTGSSRGVLGRTMLSTDSSRYGFTWSSSDGFSFQSGGITIQNFSVTYGGQTIKITGKWSGTNASILIDDIEVASSPTTRPTIGINSFFVGAHGDPQGLSPIFGRYFNGQIHSVFHGDNSWNFNEPTGFDCLNQDGLYPIEGQTSNAGGLTYWNENVIQEEI